MVNVNKFVVMLYAKIGTPDACGHECDHLYQTINHISWMLHAASTKFGDIRCNHFSIIMWKHTQSDKPIYVQRYVQIQLHPSSNAVNVQLCT